MKTTIQVPDVVFRRAKATAAERGQTLQAFVTEALREKLQGRDGQTERAIPLCMRGFGKLRALKKETAKIQRRIDRELDVVEPEDRV